MALRQVRTDDIDDREGAETREFSLEGQDYEIDLVDENMEELRKALAGFIESARKVGKARRAIKASSTRSTTITQPSNTHDLNAIREWARSKKMKVSDRGRIPKDIVDAFNSEHQGSSIFSAAEGA